VYQPIGLGNGRVSFCKRLQRQHPCTNCIGFGLGVEALLAILVCGDNTSE
jgi:hypothetical protein